MRCVAVSPLPAASGNMFSQYGLARDAGVRRQRRAAVDALRGANQLAHRREVVDARRRVRDVGRHRRIAPHQQIAAAAPDIGGLEREPLAQFAADDHVERVVVRRDDGAVERRRDDAGIRRRRLREASRRRVRQRRRNPVDALEANRRVVLVVAAEGARQVCRHAERPFLVEVARQRGADAVVDDRVAAAHGHLAVAGQPPEEAARRPAASTPRRRAGRSCCSPSRSSRACCSSGPPGRSSPAALRWSTAPPPSAGGESRASRPA